jgi:hypothetical protein
VLHIVKAYLRNLLKPRILESLRGTKEEMLPTSQISKISQLAAIEHKAITKNISPTKLSIRNWRHDLRQKEH